MQRLFEAAGPAAISVRPMMSAVVVIEGGVERFHPWAGDASFALLAGLGCLISASI
jgi:hypothetical protein